MSLSVKLSFMCMDCLTNVIEGGSTVRFGVLNCIVLAKWPLRSLDTYAAKTDPLVCFPQ